MKESEFWSRDVKPMLHGMCVYRLENGVAKGMPDVSLAWAGRQAWLELKVMKGLRIEIRHSQFKWLYKRTAHNLFDTYYAARHDDLIKVWTSETMAGFNVRESAHRETEDSIIFVPPAEDFRMKVGGVFEKYFRMFIFAHAANGPERFAVLAPVAFV